MSLTERRKHFLQLLMKLYEKTKLPVHYGAIAKAVGVSKWTAYDVLRELEKKGYLQRSYTVNPNETGRSLIVFSPTPEADLLFSQPRKGISDREEWDQVRKKVLPFLEGLGNLNLSQSVEQIVNVVSSVHTRVEFCAYILGLLGTYLNGLGTMKKDLIKRLTYVSAKPQLQLTLFVGAVTGAAIQTAGREMSLQITELIGRFVNCLDELSPEEAEVLNDFLFNL